MTSYEIANIKVNALVESIRRHSKYDDLACKNAYTAGYLHMMLIQLYHESEVVRQEVNSRFASLNGEAA